MRAPRAEEGRECAVQDDDDQLTNGQPATEPDDHRWLGYDNPMPGRFIAVCSCGWRSDPYTSAGLAGSASDQHRREVDAAKRADPGD